MLQKYSMNSNSTASQKAHIPRDTGVGKHVSSASFHGTNAFQIWNIHGNWELSCNTKIWLGLVRVQLATDPTDPGTQALEKACQENHSKGTNNAASIFLHSNPLTVMRTSSTVS